MLDNHREGIYIDKENCNSLYFNELGDLSYTRLINNKVYTFNRPTDDVIGTIYSLSKMNDDTFRLVCELGHSITKTSEDECESK